MKIVGYLLVFLIAIKWFASFYASQYAARNGYVDDFNVDGFDIVFLGLGVYFILAPRKKTVVTTEKPLSE